MSTSGTSIPNTFITQYSGAKTPRKRMTRMTTRTTRSRSTRKGSSGFRGWTSR